MQIRAPFALPSFKPLSRSASPASGHVGAGVDPANGGALTPPLSPPTKDRGRKGTESTGHSPLPSPGPFTTDAGGPGGGNGGGEQKRSRSLSRPLAKFSLTSASRSPTPVGTPAPSPKLGGAATLPVASAAAAAGTAVKGGVAAPASASADPSANMEAVGMRITEAVTRALAGSAGNGEWKGRRGIARGTGTALAKVVFAEFPAPPIDQYVLRAILRISVKHLSVFASRLETVLLPALIDPTFSHPILFAPTPPSTIRSTVNAHAAQQGSPFNPCQTFCLSLAHAAFEVRDAFGAKLAGGPAAGAEAFPKFVGDALKPVIDKLDSIVGRVVLPLLAILKRELMAALLPLAEADRQTGGAGGGVGGAVGGGVVKTNKLVYNGSGHVDVGTPACLALFASKLEHARRALQRISAGCGEAGEGWVVGIAVSTTWKGMVSLVERPVQYDRASPRAPQPKTLPGGGGALSRSATVGDLTARPLLTVKSSSSVATLLQRSAPAPPLSSLSRPSSPPGAAGRGSSPSVPLPTDGPSLLIASFEQLVMRLVDGLVPYVLPAAPDPGHLAREALAEALEALQSLRAVVTAIGRPNGLETILVGLHELKLAMGGGALPADHQQRSTEEFLDALDDVPPVLLFHLFGNRLGAALAAAGHSPAVRPTHALFGWSREQYDATVLAGFGAAEEWETKVGGAVKAEVGRVLADARTDEERRWLEALVLVVDVI